LAAEQRLGFLKAQTYILGIRINRDVRILIGRLGNISFSKGVYVYIGSAKNRLNARLRRHLSQDKKLFWHIDYLLKSKATRLKEIWIGSNKKECSIARLIYQNSNARIIRDFGSSDCGCPGHLLFIPYLKDIKLSVFLNKQGFNKIRFNYAG
jgi:Uri superfamily endonuclease